MLLVLLRAVVTACQREDQRIIALYLAELARCVCVIEQFEVGEGASRHHIRAHRWPPVALRIGCRLRIGTAMPFLFHFLPRVIGMNRTDLSRGRCCLLSQIVFVGNPVRVHNERHHARRTIRRRICHDREAFRSLQQNSIVIPMKWFCTSVVRFHSSTRQIRPNRASGDVVHALPVEAVVLVTRADKLRCVRVGIRVIYLLRVHQCPANLKRLHFISANPPVADLLPSQLCVEVPRALVLDNGDRKRPVLRSYVKRHRIIGFSHQPVHLLILMCELRPLFLAFVRIFAPFHNALRIRSKNREQIRLVVSACRCVYRRRCVDRFRKRLSLRLLGWRGIAFRHRSLRLDWQTRQSQGDHGASDRPHQLSLHHFSLFCAPCHARTLSTSRPRRSFKARFPQGALPAPATPTAKAASAESSATESAKTALPPRRKSPRYSAVVKAAERARPDSRSSSRRLISAIGSTIAHRSSKSPRPLKPGPPSVISSAIEKCWASRAIWRVIKEDPVVMPIDAPCIPSPSESEKRSDRKSYPKIKYRSSPPDTRHLIPVRPRCNRVSIHQPRVIFGDINHIRIRRGNVNLVLIVLYIELRFWL